MSETLESSIAAARHRSFLIAAVLDGSVQTVRQLALLAELASDNTHTCSTLATVLGVSRSVVSRMVTYLINQGLAVRLGEDVDRRVVHIYITPEGRKLLMHLDRPVIA